MMDEDHDHAAAMTACTELSRSTAAVVGAVDAAVGMVHGLGFTDLMLLRALGGPDGGSLRRIDLARQLGLSASAVTRALLPLEKVGLVAREPDPRDARASRAVLTEVGRERLAEADETFGAKAATLLGRLSPEEVAELVRLLRLIVPPA